MNTGMSEEQVYEIAKKRVEAKKGFYKHLAIYILVHIIQVIVWAVTSGGGYPWFLWSIGGWGIILIIHFLTAVVSKGKSDAAGIEAAVEKEAEKIKREQNQ